ncbi:MAG TPA: SDR family oxidoreductase [Burkholderiaceae bacterium]|jgi:NAD(P)-dependent dehydrogenase (short-subunit alcohol dehydrogenase family)|nr:SDR family oxidoreductase [Burkholderiaceae bacterium]
MQDFAGKVAVITGAGSGFGREFARLGAQLRMKLVLADVQQDALEQVATELRAAGAEVLAERVDVSQGDQVDTLAQRSSDAFGAVHLLFNNAGVAAGGLVWEHTTKDWDWVLGVNLWGVIHGVRAFAPRMLAHGEEGHIVNTASVAGLLSPPLMGVYNVSKHAVVTLTETLYHDLRVANAKIGCSVLCPAFVPTGIHESQRNRPAALSENRAPTASQIAARRASEKAVTSGKISAATVAQMTFDAIRERRFYVITHPKILPSVELRLQDIVNQRNPSDPFSFKPEVSAKLGEEPPV